jgi:capsid protein
MVLMDGSETNFSGWRGAIEQARLGFRDRQRDLKGQFHRPCFVWKIRQWMNEDSALRNAAEKSGISIFRHSWSTPTWPYIQPYQDAAADLLRIRNALISRRRQCAERGLNWDKISTEITEDNAMLIEKAFLKAQELNEKYPELKVTWREIASLPSPDGVNVSLQPENQQNSNQVAA